MTTIFNKVHGFNLKLPLNTASRQYPDNYGEWIEIIKKPNELPTVKLKTIVLYYRNNGDTTAFDSNNYQNIPSGESGGNYRFYNNLAGGKQLGWIWGFPLFDVGREKTSNDVSGNWPLWGSCIGADKGFSGSDTSGNETMLVDLSANKNIIVLDCSGLQPTDGSGCKDISNNITGLSGNFFMTLRIKKSKETDFIDLNTQDYGSGRRGNWNLWNGPNTQEYTKWASLVQYEYECDIIGPKGMLDFTFDYFMINDSGTGRPIYQNSSVKNYLAIPNNLSNFNSSRESSCKIITGLQTGDTDVVEKRMDITNILTNLSSIEGGPKKLQVKEKWSSDESSTVVKLIGGWYSDNSTNDLSNCYYGDNIGVGDFQTKMSTTEAKHKTEGWKNFIKLATDGDNNWSANTFDSIYELNNILWCSLQSPRKLPVRKLYGNNNLKRYITNWIDLSGGNSSNEIIGGGYGRYPNTIDMARRSSEPYYSSLSPASNSNTVLIPNFVQDTINYLDASNNILTEHDLNFFRVRYQLLIPPGDDEEFEISFTMGQDISSSVTTFFRHTGMDGSCNPVGDNNLKANRKKETITLTWDNTSVNSVNDISMQSIYFTDIASGFSHIDASFNCTDTSLNTIVTDMSKNYDISFNVFQLHFLAKSGDDRKETPYTVKSFNNNNTTQQYFDISFVPQNYEPYRYINYNKSKLGDSIETNFYFYGNHDISKVYQEQLEYNPMGRFVKDTGTTFNITASIPQPIIDISSIPRVYGITGNSTPTLPDEDIFVLTQSTGQTQITSVSGEYPVAVGPNNFKAIFYSPSSLKLGNNFIPDYWRLPDKINTLRTKYPSDYSYFDDWEKQIKVSMVYDILSLSLKDLSGDTVTSVITHILINSKNKSPQFDAGTKEDGSLVSNLNGSDLIFEVQGWKDLSDNDQLNQSPIVIELSANPGPFGPSGNSFIDGINVPYTAKSEEKYKVNTILLDKMRKKINVSTTDASYNGIFTIHISAWDDVSNNKIYAGTKMNPVNGVEVLLVDLPEITQTNGEIIVTVNNLTNALDMIDSNNSVIITWESFDFSKDTTWVTSQSNVYWTISRYNISTGKSKVVLNNETIVDLNENDEYQYIDDDVRVYEKFRYTVTGTFKWDIGSKKLELDIPGFTTSDCFVCKNNRFPYGRFNSTSSNFKLYRPLLINTLEGQVDQFGNKTCGGGCIANNAPGLNLYSQRSRISSSNNIYSNTTNQMSKKETYVRLSRSRFRPDR